MALVAADWTIDTSKNIRYIGAAHGAAGASYATVIEFHRWLQDLADDAVAVAASSDFLDITNVTPSERQTDNIIQLINGYNIDQTASEHLYDGSIIQAGGDDIWDGLVVIAARGMDLQIVQNGSIVANDFWNSVPNGETHKGLNFDAASGYSHRFMLKVRTSGADIDGRRIIGQTRVWGKTYSEFRIGTGTARGNNVLALTYADDNNNLTASGTVATWTDITNTTEGYNAIDVDANGANEFYFSKWNVNKPTRSINDFYQRMKYLTQQATAETLYGLNGELFRGITHQIAYTSLAGGTFSDSVSVSWGTGATAGTGQILADNGTDMMWIQQLTGAAPVAALTLTQSAVTATSGTVTERTLAFPFCGQSTGSAIIGAYGLGIETDDLTANDKITALDGVQRNPPNNQTFYVNGVVSGEDRILVGPKDPGADNIDFDQFTLAAGLTTNNVTSVQVNAAIPTDTPATGYIRVADNAGVYRRLHYSSYSGDTFTIDTTDGNEDFAGTNASLGNNVFIAYIDILAAATSASFSATYLSDRSLWVRVRDGAGTPIKTFESAATFGAGGGTSTVIRTTDA
ncbi:MAG: hypothetical protein NHG36_06830 [Chromatiaceae bacterium]|nr:hypothetical protein [Candidatus Thioaporhodococcus sediminis]